MSATISYRLTNPKKVLSVGAPSAFKELLEKGFSSFPLLLRNDDMERLLGMLHAVEDETYKEAIGEIIKGIQAHGEIELNANY